MARYIDVHMEDADYLSDSIDSADCSLSPMTDPDAMPALSPMCKSEYDPQSPLHHALDFMPSLSPAHESDWTQMEPWDDPQAANEVDDEFDKEMTDINETKYDNHLTWDHKQQSSQNFLDKDIEMKFSEALTAPKLGDIFDQTESGENDDSLDHIIPVYNGGSLENKVVAFDFKEMNKIHQNIGSKKPLNTKVTKIASETKGIHSTDKTELDASSNDSEVDDLPSSCKMFDTCGCGKISCRRGDRCPSQHSIVADKHKDLVTYRKVAGVTPSAGTGAVDDGGKELQTHGHWTRWKEKLDQHMVVGNISLKDSDFVSVCKKGTIQQKDLENRLTILDNCDTSTEDLRKTQTVNKRNSLSGSINSGINASDLKRCKNVTVDLIDIHKTGKKCNKLETASSEMDSNSVNMSLDKGEVKERIKKVLGGREVTVRLEDVIKDECAFLRAVNLQDTASGQVEQNEKIYVPVKSCIEKGSGSLIDVEITKCSTQRAKNLKTSGKRKKVHVCSCGSKWSLTEFKRAICSCQIETILKAVGKPKRQYIKSGKYKRSYYSVSMRKLINWRPVEKPLSHKKGQKKKNKTLTGPVHVNVMGRFKDFIGNVSASENIQGTQSPSESAPETQSQSKSFRDIQTPSKSVAASQSTLESATDTQGLSESDPCAESDSQASQGHFMHTLGLLETSRLPQVALKAAPKVDSDDQPTTGKSTRVCMLVLLP